MKFFTLQRDGAEAFPVTFDERPQPGKRNAYSVIPGSVREIPEQYANASLDELHELLIEGKI